jgi:hypothetical protein
LLTFWSIFPGFANAVHAQEKILRFLRFLGVEAGPLNWELKASTEANEAQKWVLQLLIVGN